MKKIKISDIFKIIKDILTKTCIYYTVITLGITVAAWFFNLGLHSSSYFIFALASLGAGAAVQVYKIRKLPAASRHIAFFILMYVDFLLMIFIPLSQHTVTPNTTFYLSISFIVIYLVVFGIVMGIRAVVNNIANKKLHYDKQFKNTEF